MPSSTSSETRWRRSQLMPVPPKPDRPPTPTLPRKGEGDQRGRPDQLPPTPRSGRRPGRPLPSPRSGRRPSRPLPSPRSRRRPGRLPSALRWGRRPGKLLPPPRWGRDRVGVIRRHGALGTSRGGRHGATRRAGAAAARVRLSRPRWLSSACLWRTISASSSVSVVRGRRRRDREVVDDPAAVHHEDAVGEDQRLVDVVGHEDDGAPRAALGLRPERSSTSCSSRLVT